VLNLFILFLFGSHIFNTNISSFYRFSENIQQSIRSVSHTLSRHTNISCDLEYCMSSGRPIRTSFLLPVASYLRSITLVHDLKQSPSTTTVCIQDINLVLLLSRYPRAPTSESPNSIFCPRLSSRESASPCCA